MSGSRMTNDQEWRTLILAEIRQLRADVNVLTKEVHQVNAQLSSLKVRVAGIATVVTAVVSFIITMLTK